MKSEFALGYSDVSCGMESKSTTNHKLKSNCCEDEYQKIQIEDDYTPQLTIADFSPSFIIAFVTVYFDFANKQNTKKLYTSYLPPPLIRDIPVMVQSFLI